MGCSPSKGKLFSKPEHSQTLVTSQNKESKDKADHGPVDDDENGCEITEARKGNDQLSTEEQLDQETATCLLASEALVQNQKGSNRPEENGNLEEGITDQQTPDQSKTEKTKKNRGKRRFTNKKRKSSIIRAKVDFPPQMVRAHQAAYTFLNPNISKYETLLGLLDQAAQTRMSLQPLMSALVFRFEEINQALEEMAEEGELMLKEHGDFLALRSGMMASLAFSATSPTDRVNPPDTPPDLLQLLLKHSTEKMRHVGNSVQALGDTTLEDAVDYFSSLSKLLVEKLLSKQAAEQRLTQVLCRVEEAAIKKSHLEDSLLHSEDSGIGGENESLPGSERHRHHRGSAGSGSCGSGINIRSATDNPTVNSPNRLDHNENEEENYDNGDVDDDDDDDDDEDDNDERDRPERKRSNSSPPDPNQAFIYMQLKYIEDQHASVNRQPSSTRTVNILTDLQMSQKYLDQRMRDMNEIPGNKMGRQNHVCCARSRRYSFHGLGSGQKVHLQTIRPRCCFPMLTPRPPKRRSVKRLINTFSQGVEGKPGQCLASVSQHIIRPKTSGDLMASDSNARDLSTNGTSWPEGRDEMDADNLPPPPPEVLMDNSFQRNNSLPGNKEQSKENAGQGLPVTNRKTRYSSRLKASMQDMNVLPNRSSVRPRLTPLSLAHPVRQDAVMETQDAVLQAENGLDLDTEKAQCLYQQARKIIHLRNSVECPNKRHSMDLSNKGNLPLNTRVAHVFENNDCYEGAGSCNLPVIAPPVSRVRLPPSCPSVSHRIPFPPGVRPQCASQTSSRPSSPKAVVRATDNPPEDIIPSVSFRDARSVFCQNETQCTQVPGGSVIPRGCVETVRGRLLTRGIINNSRRTQSEQRPGVMYRSDITRDDTLTATHGK